MTAEADRIVYPQAPKGSQVDDYFGTKVPDPYRDLENADSATTKKWIEAENKRKQSDYDEKLKKAQDRVTELNKRFGNWYYVIADDEYKKIQARLPPAAAQPGLR